MSGTPSPFQQVTLCIDDISAMQHCSHDDSQCWLEQTSISKLVQVIVTSSEAYVNCDERRCPQTFMVSVVSIIPGLDLESALGTLLVLPSWGPVRRAIGSVHPAAWPQLRRCQKVGAQSSHKLTACNMFAIKLNMGTHAWGAWFGGTYHLGLPLSGIPEHGPLLASGKFSIWTLLQLRVCSSLQSGAATVRLLKFRHIVPGSRAQGIPLAGHTHLELDALQYFALPCVRLSDLRRPVPGPGQQGCPCRVHPSRFTTAHPLTSMPWNVYLHPLRALWACFSW